VFLGLSVVSGRWSPFARAALVPQLQHQVPESTLKFRSRSLDDTPLDFCYCWRRFVNIGSTSLLCWAKIDGPQVLDSINVTFRGSDFDDVSRRCVYDKVGVCLE